MLDAAGGWPGDTPEVEDAREAVAAQAGRRRPGQGGRASAAERQAIERHAVQMGTAHYEAQRWSVRNVGAERSYDLHCTRPGGEELRVEVKGTTSAGTKVVLTRNEVAHAYAHHPNVALFIVSNISLSSRNDQPSATGGEVMVFEPWDLDDTHLSPIGYEYTVPREQGQEK